PYAECMILCATLLGRDRGTGRGPGRLAALGTGELRLCPALGEGQGDGPAGGWTLPATAVEGTGSGLRLTGHKTLVTGAAIAQAALVTARDAAGGIVLALVPLDAPGVQIRAYPTIDGRGACDIRFDDVALAAGDILLEGAEAAEALAE